LRFIGLDLAQGSSSVTGYCSGVDNTESVMDLNVGSADRAMRVVIGLGLILLAAMGVIGVWGYVGIVPLITGIVRVCPAYSLLGINSCGTGKGAGKT
jgi:hypothetical protein